MNRAAVRLALAMLAVLPALEGCVLTCASMQGLGGTRYPEQRAAIDGRRLVVEEAGGARRRQAEVVPAPAVQPLEYRVVGGPARSTCACWRSAYGLVEHVEAMPYRVEAKDAQGAWSAASVDVRPFEERATLGVAAAIALLPVTVGLDVVLLPLEAIFILARM